MTEVRDTGITGTFAPSNPPIMTITGYDHKEILRFEPNGDIFVHGKLVESDKEVVDGFRDFMNQENPQAAAEKERVDKAESSSKEWMEAYWSLHGKYKVAEEREQKLKNAVALELIEAEASKNTICADRLRTVLVSLYPLYKEEDK